MSDTIDERWQYVYAARYIAEQFGPKHEELAHSGTGEAGFVETKPTLKMHEADRLLFGICRDANLNVREVAERLARKYLEAQGS